MTVIEELQEHTNNLTKVCQGELAGGKFTKLKQSLKQRFETCVKKSRMK
jgi:hypothetical protein